MSNQEVVTQEPQPIQLELTPLEWKSEPKTAETNQQLATLIGTLSAKLLTWLGKTKSSHYSTFSIPKRDGSYRQIFNPDQILRVAQYKLLHNVLEHIKVPDYIYAFEREKSIPKMALVHVNKKIVISVDIKDFFHSIKQSNVKSMMDELGFGEKAARTISELCTYKFFVPQGALTSPKISNLIAARTFGPVLKRYCDEKGFAITIYADDVTISSDSPDVPVKEVLQFLTSTISGFGFRVNKAKTKVMSRKTRQYVCGVVVNEKTNLKKYERQRLRAIVHNVTKNGINAEAERCQMSPDKFVSVIQGKLNWFSQLNAVQGAALKEKFLDYVKSQNTISSEPSLESNVEA